MADPGHITRLLLSASSGDRGALAEEGRVFGQRAAQRPELVFAHRAAAGVLRPHAEQIELRRTANMDRRDVAQRRMERLGAADRVAVEGQHGGKAVLVEVLPVKEVFQGQTVWEGVVHVFDLDGHPKATRAYAWSSPVEGSDKPRFYDVLHLGGIRSSLDAVRAAIVAERRS